MTACTLDLPASCLGILAAASAVSSLSHPSGGPATSAHPPQSESDGEVDTQDSVAEPSPEVLPGRLLVVLPGVLARAALVPGLEGHGRHWIRDKTASLLVCHPGLLGPLLRQLPLAPFNPFTIDGRCVPVLALQDMEGMGQRNVHIYQRVWLKLQSSRSNSVAIVQQ